jgi:flagellar biosynthesis protein FlhA
MAFLARLRRTIGHQDLLFATGMVLLLAVLVLPMPSWLVDLGLATSITLSVLILMVAIWIERPLDFSVFPTVLLVATLLRLALNLATTRLSWPMAIRGWMRRAASSTASPASSSAAISSSA